jgi:hypothetical protein
MIGYSFFIYLPKPLKTSTLLSQVSLQKFTRTQSISVDLVPRHWNNLPSYQPYQRLSKFLQQFNTRKVYSVLRNFKIESNCKTFLKLQHLCLKITSIPIPTLMRQLTPKERDPETNHLIKPSAINYRL